MFDKIRESRRRLLIVFISLSCLILIITIGFAALSAALNVNVSSITQTTQDWDVGFVPETVTAEENGTSSVGRTCPTATSTKTSITFGEITLSKPGDSCTYEFTIENNGTIAADLDSILFSDPLEETCSGDASSKTCGNITYELWKDDEYLSTSNGYVCEDNSYKLTVTIRNSGNALASSTITQTNGRYTLTFVQSTKDECYQDPHDPDNPSAPTIYNVLKGEATTGTYASEYTGSHQDSMAGVGTKGIYHWKADNDTEATAIQDKWNVIFGDFCWQMIRTTDTGGVKLIYDGEPSEGECNNSGISQQIGTSRFNINDNSPAYAGYMYNPSTMIVNKGNSAATSGSLFGKGVSYSGGTYTLTNTSTTYDENHHYTCNNTTGTCSTVRYYYYNNYYTEISDGRTIEQCLEDMLSADNVNQTDSIMKTYIENWYQSNLRRYTDDLEDTIYCHDRSIKSLGGWNPNGGNIDKYLYFNSDSLNCINDTDKYSVSNNKAKLKYPVGFVSDKESNLLNNPILWQTGEYYYIGSAYNFINTGYQGHIMLPQGFSGVGNVSNSAGVRPAISLKPGIEYVDGDGSKTNPYLVSPR